jgi:diguanylate cyclase (GGDEF)-like protein
MAPFGGKVAPMVASPSPMRRLSAVLLTVSGILVVAYFDFLSGVELRVYPMYYLPVAFAAWHLGRGWTIAAAVASTAAWTASNYVAGLRYSTEAIWAINSAMHAASFLVVGILIAQLKVLLSHERELGRRDALTGLLNARAFHEEARRVLAEARRKRRALTMTYIDVDDFKAVNDRLGHHAGDEVLKGIAEAIRSSTRISDVAARMGGDEFAILLPETGRDEARLPLDRLRAHLEETFGAEAGAVTASIGAVAFTDAPVSVEEMVRLADERMYAAKAAGKNRLQLDLAAGLAPVTASSG